MHNAIDNHLAIDRRSNGKPFSYLLCANPLSWNKSNNKSTNIYRGEGEYSGEYQPCGIAAW